MSSWFGVIIFGQNPPTFMTPIYSTTVLYDYTYVTVCLVSWSPFCTTWTPLLPSWISLYQLLWYQSHCLLHHSTYHIANSLRLPTMDRYSNLFHSQEILRVRSIIQQVQHGSSLSLSEGLELPKLFSLASLLEGSLSLVPVVSVLVNILEPWVGSVCPAFPHLGSW